MLVTGLTWTAGAPQPPQQPGDQSGNFTGGIVTTVKAEGRLSYLVFAPGGRTKRHTHTGQLILAEEGRALTQVRGEAVRELRVGAPIWSPPGATHWHGAAPDTSAKLYQISRGQTTWLEEVRDQDYRLPPKRS